MKQEKDKDLSSRVDLGSKNVFSGAIGNIAGRDIHHHTTIQNFIDNSHLDPQSLLAKEREFTEDIINLYSIVESTFIPPYIKINTEITSEEEIPIEFRAGFSPELFSIFHDGQPIAMDQRQQKVVDYLSLLDGENKLLIGPLGYGKTTLLKMLAIQVARKHLLKNKEFELDHKGLTQRHLGLLLPIFVDFHNYDSRLDLIDFIKQYAWREPSGNYLNWTTSIAYILFDLFLAQGKFVLLLDAMDSLPDDKLGKIQSELEWLIVKYPNNLIIVSGRSDEIGYELGLSKAYIESWDDIQIAAFLQIRLGQSDGQYAYQLIKNNTLLYPWASIPYIAFAIALYYEKYSVLPIRADGIVEKLIAALLERRASNEQDSQTMTASLRQFLSEVAFRSIAEGGDLGRQLRGELLLEVAASIKVDREEMIDQSVQMGFLSGERDSDFRFKNQLIGYYFVGSKLKNMFLQNKDQFINAISDSYNINRIQRSSLFRKPSIGKEIAWDRPLPKIERSKWFEGLSMTLAMLPENQWNDFLDILTSTTCLTAGDLIEHGRFNVEQNSVRRIVDKLVNISEDPKIELRVRLKVLYLLGKLGDPRIGNENMCHIPAGKAVLGSLDSSKYVTVESFFIDTFLVTNKQYQDFIDSGGYEKEKWWTTAGWQWIRRTGRKEPTYWHDERFNSSNQPVVGIAWYEAYAYSQWANKRLPTEAEWERTAVWNEHENKATKFPTGDIFFDGIGNLLVEEFEYIFCTSPVGAYPLGVSSHGVHDLVGNVWEWLSTEFDMKPYGDNLENTTSRNARCLRGGSWGLEQVPGAICTTRHKASPETYSAMIGFRCAK